MPICIALTVEKFAPQVGDVDNNLNRADAVLSKANPQNLDILILPELAFSGMFESWIVLDNDRTERRQDTTLDRCSISVLFSSLLRQVLRHSGREQLL
jgi:predicted amidohydrolase